MSVPESEQLHTRAQMVSSNWTPGVNNNNKRHGVGREMGWDFQGELERGNGEWIQLKHLHACIQFSKYNVLKKKQVLFCFWTMLGITQSRQELYNGTIPSGPSFLICRTLLSSSPQHTVLCSILDLSASLFGVTTPHSQPCQQAYL